jgi:hypothetical protein
MENNSTPIPAAGKKRRTYNNRNNANNNNNGLSLAQRHNTRKNNGKRARGNSNSAKIEEVAKHLGMSRAAIESMAVPVAGYDSINKAMSECALPNNNDKASNTNCLKYGGIPFYYITQGKFDSLEKKQDLRAVILDNDETTGYYVTAFKNYFVKNKETKKSYNDVINDLLVLLTTINKKTGKTLLRPGYDVFFKKLRELKDKKIIDAVIMYTNMEKGTKMKIEDINYNRPQLLAAVFDRISGGDGSDPLFDLLIFRMKSRPNPEKYIDVVNTIFKINGESNKYLFLDDNPEVIYNTTSNNTRKQSKFAHKVNGYYAKNGNIGFTNKNKNNNSIMDLLTRFNTPKKNDNATAKANAKAEEA